MENETFVQLSESEMAKINGGYESNGLIGEAVSFLGAAAKSVQSIFSSTMEYQSSLPANLKK